MSTKTQTTAQTATEAFSRYSEAMEAGTLMQSGWHKRDDDGRMLACALGVIGPNIDNATRCPAAIMPRWLAKMVVWFFDSQDFDDAKAWGLKFYAELSRIDGKVPFSVVNDWNANIVGPLAIEVATKRGRNVAAHVALVAMHAKALAGEKFTADEWRPVLKEAFGDVYASYAYAYANANANAYANADADAYAYADAYADANADAYAYADAYANANAYADANADADAYAKRSALKRLADGMVECLARVPGDA